MILSLQILYIALLAGAMAAGCVYAWWQRGSIGRQERLERTLSQRYVRIVMAVMLSRESLPTRLPMIEMWGARALLARVLSALSSSVYGEDVTVVGRIVAENDVEREYEADRLAGFVVGILFAVGGVLLITNGIHTLATGEDIIYHNIDAVYTADSTNGIQLIFVCVLLVLLLYYFKLACKNLGKEVTIAARRL